MRIIDNIITELKLTLKDEGLLLFMLIVPLAYPLAYSWIYTNEVVHEVPVVVVDKSDSPESRDFIRRYDASPNVDVAFRAGSLNEAKTLIGKQKAYGVLFFPEDYAVRLNRMEQAHVGIYCDMTLLFAYKNIYQTATQVMLDTGKDIKTKLLGNYTAREDEVSTAPFAIDEKAIFNTTGGYGNCVLPAVLVIILQQTMLLAMGLRFGTRREKTGSSLPAYTNPADGSFSSSILGFMTTRGLAYMLLYLVLGAYELLVIPQMFHFVSIIYPLDLAVFLVSYLVSCLTFSGLTMSVIRQREDVMIIVVFTSILFIFLTGVSWPASNIPGFWKLVSYLIPSTFGVQGFIRMNTMGARLSDIMPLILALWVQALVYGVGAWAVLRSSHAKSKKNDKTFAAK